MRRDLGLLRPGDEIAVDLHTLIGRRTDLVSDRTRQINRLHAQLPEIFSAFERALTPKGRGLITLLTGYQTPAAIRRAGARRLESWLRRHHVRNAARWPRPRSRQHTPRRSRCPGRTWRP